ncbi:hypothetical protein OAE25_00830 [Verrucomicrobiales bacterium]|nr:hypothetical protein [Verrucomicrobiales bacterium]
MVLFAILDLVTGYFGKDLVINEFIYDSFVWVVLGSFGISEIGKTFGGKKESTKPPTTTTTTDNDNANIKGFM